MFDYVYTDHAQYTIKMYAKMALFSLILTGPLSVDLLSTIYGQYASNTLSRLSGGRPQPRAARGRALGLKDAQDTRC